MNAAQHILVGLVRAYRVLVSPLLVALFSPLGLGCRFNPTCSEHALDAVRQHGAIKGAWLALRRLGRCHPWGGCGHDPVPGPPSESVALPATASGPARAHGST